MKTISLLSMSTTTVFLLYAAILAASVIFAFLSQKKRVIDNYQFVSFHIKPFLISFAILGLFSFFITTGTDFGQYVKIYNASKISSLSNFYLEPGYRLLNIILRIFIKDAYVGVGVIKLIFIALVFRGLYTLKDDIHIGTAVLAFVTLFYLQSFNLIRIYFAGAILFCGLSELWKNNRVGRFIIAVLIATTIHYTAIAGLFILLVYLFINMKKIQSLPNKIKYSIIVAIALIIPIVSPFVIKFMVNSISAFHKYIAYIGKGTLGIGQIAFYTAPFLAIIIMMLKESNEKITMAFAFVCMCFSIALLGYSIGMITRMSFYFSSAYLIVIPMFCRKILYDEEYSNVSIQNINNNHIITKLQFVYRIDKKIIMAMVILYFAFRFILSIKSLATSDGINCIATIFVR